MNKHLINWLTAKGATNVKDDGTWISWTSKEGYNCYASINDLNHEFRNAR